jgi:hypothetical protein
VPQLHNRRRLGRTRGRLCRSGSSCPTKRAFSPEDLDLMGTAFIAALAKLGLNDLKDPMTEMVARRIITAVRAGERNVIRLTEIGAGERK